MQLSKIIVPTDFSPASEPPLRYATALARDTGAMLVITHVQEPPLAYGAGEYYVGAAASDDVDELKARLEQVVPPDASVPCEHHLLSGDPARSIVELAESERADLIVLGTHGRTGLMRLLMGSVAEAVVRRAPCPVFTLRQPEASGSGGE